MEKDLFIFPSPICRQNYRFLSKDVSEGCRVSAEQIQSPRISKSSAPTPASPPPPLSLPLLSCIYISVFIPFFQEIECATDRLDNILRRSVSDAEREGGHESSAVDWAAPILVFP